jgi:signal transduction histidine kinase
MILTLATLCLMGEGYIALADEQAMLIRIVGQAMIVTGSAVPAVYLMMRMFQSYRYAELYRSKERDARIAVNANSEITPIVFREIAVQLREPLAITDTTGRVLFANDKLIEMSGLAKKQILGGLPSLWQHVSTAPDFYRKAFDAMRGNKETFEGVVHNSYPNDRRRSYDALVRITPVLDEVGDIACCVLQQRNLTADQERTELLRHVINTMPIGVLLLDARTMDITLISTQAEYMLGRAELNLRATKNFSDIAAKFLQSDGTPYDTSSLPPYLATKDRRTHEVKNLIIGEGQKRMTWTMAATPFTGGDGSITDILVAIDDVSRNQTFEHSMTDFVSVASHQLRTPLTGIKWSLDALRKADVKMSDEDKRLLFETCYEASDRMMITIQQLLQVAEFERGGKALKPEPVSIETSIKGNVASLKALIDRKKLTFKESVLSALPPLMTDPFFVSQLTMNIIENAVKYTPDGGEIDSILRLKDGAIEWTLHDTGIGIPKSSLPKIFEKFFRADNAQKLVPDGTGLGLTIVRSIVDMLGGSIRIESEEGRGTTVEVRLPLKGKE